MQESNPFTLFSTWFEQANNTSIDKPNALILSTISQNGCPSSRVLLLSSFNDKGFVFHTNYNSHKGLELEKTPEASILFWWDELGYQIRIEGKVEKTTAEESDLYFSHRPQGSQIGAWASDQSNEITSRKELEKKVQEFVEKYKGLAVPRPPHWGGYRLKPERMEFWINRDDRLHERYLYQLNPNSQWQMSTLSP